MALCAFLALFLHKNRIIMAEFADILIRWYDENKRDLPWRNTKDPYRIWISEIILQQTRVAQGYDYYKGSCVGFPMFSPWPRPRRMK